MEKEKLDVIVSYRDYYGQYHHHKEQMAYAATALYLTAAAWLMFAKPEDIEPICHKLYAAGFVVIVAGAALAFVCWQLRQRRAAANMVEASTRLLARLVAGQPLDLVDYRCYNHLLLPRFLVDELEYVANGQSCYRGPVVSELITYFVMVATAMLGAIRIFFMANAI